MRDGAFFCARVPGAAAVTLALALAGCELAGVTGPDGLLDVSLPGHAARPGQEVVFEGQVVAVELEDSTFLLADGTAVRLTEGVVPGEEFGVTSLAGAAEALEGELELIVWGSGTVETAEPLVVEAAELTFKPVERIEFEGRVAAVDVAAGTFTFENGAVVKVTRATELGDDFEVPSLEAASEALEAGEDLVAWGHGWERGEAPLRLLAHSVTFKVAPPPAVEFEGDVVVVRPDSGLVRFADGTVVRVTGETVIKNEFGIATLAAARERLEAGDSLVAWGHGGLEGEEPRTIEAFTLVFKVRGEEPVAFEGHVASVNADQGTFTLADGTVIRTDAETTFGDTYGIASLAAAKEALEAGEVVAAWGEGLVEAEEPPTLLAGKVTFKVVE